MEITLTHQRTIFKTRCNHTCAGWPNTTAEESKIRIGLGFPGRTPTTTLEWTVRACQPASGLPRTNQIFRARRHPRRRLADPLNVDLWRRPGAHPGKRTPPELAATSSIEESCSAGGGGSGARHRLD